MKDETEGEIAHDSLLLDLQVVMDKAISYEFHDFKNTTYPMPKVALVNMLADIIDNVKNGKYDN